MTPVLKYFQAEKLYCIFGVIIAAVSIITSLYFLIKINQPFQRGIAYPFLVLGIFFLIICTTVALRSSSDISRVEKFIEQKSSGLMQGEIIRMQKVMKSFKAIIAVELFLIAASITFFLLLKNPFWKGIAAGIFVHASFFLVFDLLAESRGKEYLQFLSGLRFQ